MQDILLKTSSMDSVIHCGEGAFGEYAPRLKDRQLFIVTDKNVFALYRHLLWETFGNDVPIKIIPSGESSKTQRYLTEIFAAMAEAGIKRNGCVIAFGGGVVGDVAGLAASLYMRGVHLVQIPTTLLSQVDSSVGGKTAIDFGNIKNMIGTFYQPEQVIVDPRFLETLPAREIRCGLGEIIKHGALDKAIYKKLLEAPDIFDLRFLGSIVPDNIRCKANVVAKDERESGLRKILNLGHTTGHAFELFYKRKSHGEFVLIGMYYELYIAKAMGINGGTYFENLVSLIKAVVGKIPCYEDVEKAALLAKFDKKNSSEKITLIVPKAEGEYAELELPAYRYAELITECRNLLRGNA